MPRPDDPDPHGVISHLGIAKDVRHLWMFGSRRVTVSSMSYFSLNADIASMPTMSDAVPGAGSLPSWKSVRGKGDTGRYRPEDLSRGRLVLMLLIVAALIVGGSLLLALSLGLRYR
jgi:hypothetical protein